MSDRFTLTAAQTERLLACRAAWEEGEDEERLERLRRREEDVETLQAFAQVLQEADFANGGDLTFAQMTRLLTLARLLAPNPNLDARLLRQPDEPGALNRDLRDLLYGAATLPIRLRGFLQRRAVGGQTASQWLCAAFPREWPLVSQTGLKALELTPEQRASARQTARLRFDLPLEPPNKEANAVPDSDPVLRLLAEVVIYEAAQEVLEAADYIAMHRVLTQGLAQKPGRGRQRGVAPLLYTPHPADSAMTVREEGVGRWALGVGEQETEGEKGRRGERKTQLPNYPITQLPNTQHPTPNAQRPFWSLWSAHLRSRALPIPR